jgi:predicted RNA-binding Zn-ribbon protein involved in translation (DUF1610 family)
MNIPEANLRNMLKAISDGNHVLNEQVKFNKASKMDCPDCGYDPVRKESTNFDCDTCGGTGSVTTVTSQQISASVETEDDFNYEYTKAGRLTKGQILLTVDIKEIKEILNVDGKYDINDYSQLKAFLDQYENVTWLGARYKIDSFEAGVLQTNIYEIALKLSLVE